MNKMTFLQTKKVSAKKTNAMLKKNPIKKIGITKLLVKNRLKINFHYIK